MSNLDTVAALEAAPDTPPGVWAERIRASWQQSVAGILETGRLLTSCREAIGHGNWLEMCQKELPFTVRTAEMLMAIGRDPRLANPKHVSLLPASWGTLHKISRLKDDEFDARIKDGTIRPDMERADLTKAKHTERQAAHAAKTYFGAKVSDLERLTIQGYKFRAILADPPWHFVAYSDKGEGRSASTHYTTDRAWRDIIELPVKKLAADDCVLFLWMVDWCPKLALEVIEAWGFAHKTVAFTWVKRTESDKDWHMGQGYWTRANPESCWLATRGKPKRIHADVRQLIISPVMEHSRKPDEIYERIERLVDGPYLELYARHERQNWQTWGNELAFKMPDYQAETGEVIEVPQFLGAAE